MAAVANGDTFVRRLVLGTCLALGFDSSTKLSDRVPANTHQGNADVACHVVRLWHLAAGKAAVAETQTFLKQRLQRRRVVPFCAVFIDPKPQFLAPI